MPPRAAGSGGFRPRSRRRRRPWPKTATRRPARRVQCRRAARFRDRLSHLGEPRRALRRLVLRGRYDDRDLLPAKLPGDDAAARPCAPLPDGRGRPGGRLSRLPALSAGRRAGFATVEPASRRGGARHASDRRRRSRPRGRRGTRPAPRLQPASPAPPAHRTARRGTTRPRPGAARPDRTAADRDDRRALQRGRLRRRVFEPATVQRHGADGLRADAHRHPAAGARAAAPEPPRARPTARARRPAAAPAPP